MSNEQKKELKNIHKDYEKTYGFRTDSEYIEEATKGLNADMIGEISRLKGEPRWMLDFRLLALETFQNMPDPEWMDRSTFEDIKYDDLYYDRATDKQFNDWDDVPDYIKETFDILGEPEAARKFLGGASAQFKSEVVYNHIQEELEQQGVNFLDIDSGLKQYEELFKKYFAPLLPPDDNKFATLNSAAGPAGVLSTFPPE